MHEMNVFAYEANKKFTTVLETRIDASNPDQRNSQVFRIEKLSRFRSRVASPCELDAPLHANLDLVDS